MERIKNALKRDYKILLLDLVAVNLAYYLNEKEKVVAVVPTPEKLSVFKEYSNLTVVKAAFEDFTTLGTLIPFDHIDIFYYLAWGGYGKATNNYTAQIQNIKPLCDTVSEAAKIGCDKFVFSSSFSEFMISEHESKTHDQGAFCNVYGSTKHAARLLAQAVAAQKGVKFISVAFANTFGPGDNSHRSTNLFLHRLLNGQALDLTEGNHLLWKWF